MRTSLLILVSIFLPIIAFAQKAITGQVLDNFDEPVIGASVLEKGTTNGTITDLDGNFNLTVSNEATLVISYIGYATQEISVVRRYRTTGRSCCRRLWSPEEIKYDSFCCFHLQ